MRIMGLDVGTKTIGVAVSDELGMTAQPIEVIRRKSLVRDIDQLNRLIDEYDIDKIVLGQPRNMDGTMGAMAEKVEKFGGRLEESIDLPIEYWDERLSTVSAERMLIQAEVRRNKRRKVIDKVAAAIILQNYLDHLSLTGGGGV